VPSRRYLWISFSRSGESSEGVVVLKKALADCPNVKRLVVTCNSEGQMYRDVQGKSNALGVLLDEGVNDRGLAMTSSFTNMVIAGHCLAHVNSLDQYERVLACLVEAGSNFVPAAADRAEELSRDVR